MGSFISQPEEPKSKQAGMIWFETQSIHSLSKGYILWCKSKLQRQVTREELEIFFGIPLIDGRSVVKILAKDKEQTKVDILEFVIFACLMSKMVTWRGKSRLLATLFDFNQDFHLSVADLVLLVSTVCTVLQAVGTGQGPLPALQNLESYAKKIVDDAAEKFETEKDERLKTGEKLEEIIAGRQSKCASVDEVATYFQNCPWAFMVEENIKY